MLFTKQLNKNHNSLNKSIALIDCNNFYASCERIFNPKLIGHPIVVFQIMMVVLLLDQKKQNLGIKMGEPYFKDKKYY